MLFRGMYVNIGRESGWMDVARPSCLVDVTMPNCMHGPSSMQSMDGWICTYIYNYA